VNAPVIFILAPSYHGATLLSLNLGNHDKIASLGDTIPTLEFDQTCGCGKKVSQCQFWQRIRYLIPERGESSFIPRYPKLVKYSNLNRYIVYSSALFINKLGFTWNATPFFKSYNRFVGFVLDYYNKPIFIDGAKSISRYLSVKAAGGNVLGIIHIVRDPRGYVTSAKKNKLSISSACKQYNSYHKKVYNTTRLLKEKSILVEYEQLTKEPQRIIEAVLDFFELNKKGYVVKGIGSDIHWMGNSSLFKFDGRFYQNTKWMDELTDDEQMFIYRKTRKTYEKLKESGWTIG